MFKFFYYGLLGITMLLLYNCFNLFRMPTGSKDASLNTKLTFGGITIACILISGLVWYLSNNNHQRWANITLGGFYGIIILFTIYAAMNVRWN
ncbi:MAG: hypothetical protein WBO76_04690 [Saprospiraceae bacterium]